jgi:hypothetical protein
LKANPTAGIPSLGTIKGSEVEVKKESDSILVIGYRLGCARAKEYADSLTKENIPNKLQLVEPIYNEKDYLHSRYGIFYPKF